MTALRLELALAVAAAFTTGCDSKESGGGAAAEEKTDAPAEAKEQAAEEAKAKDENGKEDRGHATVTVGGTKWVAESCRAKPRKDSLKISCSTVEMKDGKVDREAIDFVLPDYTGPGTYKAGRMSTFSGVGFDSKKATDAENPDKAAKEAITEGMTGAKIVMLDGMEVTVTKADGGFVDGTFSKPADELMKKPAFEDGTFHARLKEEKK